MITNSAAAGTSITGCREDYMSYYGKCLDQGQGPSLLAKCLLLLLFWLLLSGLLPPELKGSLAIDSIWSLSVSLSIHPGAEQVGQSSVEAHVKML